MKTLAEFLELVPDLHQTERYRHLDRLWKYYEGKQYAERRLDICGYVKGLSGVPGSTTHSPPMCERDPGAVWNVTAEAVDELTNWAVADDAWCAISIPDDEDASDYVNALAEQATMVDQVSRCRSNGGAVGTAVASVAIRNGEFFIEPHVARDVWVLEWADETSHVPSKAVLVYEEHDPFAKDSDRDKTWVARIWTTEDERIMRRVRTNVLSRALGSGWKWELVGEPVVHGFPFCPVVYFPQRAKPGSHEGRPDAPHTCELVDEINELMGAAGATTKRNADDTLVVREDPSLNPGQVKKGGFNVIFARGGAEYLSQNGESAKICMEVAKERADQYFRRAHVIIPNADEMGAATSGEALRRRFQPMTRATSALRREYERGFILPLCKMMLRMARITLARGGVLNIPPRVEEVEGKTVITERVPGESEAVRLTWPGPFQASSADVSAFIGAATTATGNKQIMARRTAVTQLASMGVKIDSVDEELAAIDEDEKAAAERSAEAIGLATAAEGAAGPVEAEEGGKEPPGGPEGAGSAPGSEKKAPGGGK